MADKKKMGSSSLSDSSLDSVSGGAGRVELDHVSSAGVKWYKVTDEKTGKTIKTNYEKRANELANNPNDPSWGM